MGFGLLLIGCMLLFPTCFHFFYTMPLACVFLVWGGKKLGRVNTPFGWSWYVATGMGVLALGESIVRLLQWDEVVPVLDGLLCLLLLVWCFFVMTGLEWVSTETGLSKLRMKAYRQKIFACFVWIPQILMNFLSLAPVQESVVEFLTSMTFALMLVGSVVMVLHILTLHTAYMRICMPEDLDMAPKPSRFAFIRRMEEQKAARAKEREAAYQEELRERRARKTQKKKKKK